MSLDRRPSPGRARAILRDGDPNAPHGTCRAWRLAVFLTGRFHRCASVESRAASRGEVIGRTDQTAVFGFASRFFVFPPRRTFFSFPSETTRARHSRVAHRTHATRRGRGANALDSRARRHWERRGSAGRWPSGDSHPRRGRGKSRLRKQRRQLSGRQICPRRPATAARVREARARRCPPRPRSTAGRSRLTP
jgi:hypothetical protein